MSQLYLCGNIRPYAITVSRRGLRGGRHRIGGGSGFNLGSYLPIGTLIQSLGLS